MRSISIVYKLRDKKMEEEMMNPIKRSVDHYYKQLIEKEKNMSQINNYKQDLRDKIRIKTSKKRKQEDQHQLYASLNVMPLAVLPAPESFRR